MQLHNHHVMSNSKNKLGRLLVHEKPSAEIVKKNTNNKQTNLN